MGLVTADIELANARRDELLPIKVEALVNSGANLLCIPREVALQLQLETHDQRTVTTADGETQVVDYVGPIRVRFANRQCLVGALVLGDQPLLGAVPMEDMDLVIDPSRRTLAVNPAHPNIAAALAKGIRTAHL